MDSVGEGEGGKIWENGIETCILLYVKQITSPGSMHQTYAVQILLWRKKPKHSSDPAWDHATHKGGSQE